MNPDEEERGQPAKKGDLKMEIWLRSKRPREEDPRFPGIQFILVRHK